MSRWRDRLVVALATVILGTTLVSAQPFRSGPGLTVIAGGGSGGVTAGTASANQCAYWTSASAIAGDADCTFDGTTFTVTNLVVSTAALPDANDGAALGSATVSWSDLFLASGGVINWANSNVTLTHSTGILVMGSGTNTLSLDLGTVATYSFIGLSGQTASTYRIGISSGNGLALNAPTGETIQFRNNNADVATINGTELAFAAAKRLGYAVQAATCADNGNGGTPGTLTLQPTANVITFTNSDAQGCTVTMSETAPLAGMRVTIIVISNAGGTVDFADSAGVLEIGTTVSLALDDALTLMYANSAWYAMAYKDN